MCNKEYYYKNTPELDKVIKFTDELVNIYILNMVLNRYFAL